MQPTTTQTQSTPSIERPTEQPELIVNPVTGDRLTVLCSTLESDGAYLKLRFDLPPGAKGSPLHYHTQMHETFTVLSGCLEMEVGHKGNRRTLSAGESLQVPAGTHHSFRNASADWVTFTSENQPAGQFEQFIRGLFGLAIDGQVDRDGMPTNLLHFALLLNKADTILVGPPLKVQRLLIGTLVRLAGWLRTEQSLLQYWEHRDGHQTR